MKRAIFTLLVSALCLPAWAQYYILSYENIGRNPGGLNQESETAGTPADWNTILTGGTSQSWSDPVALPFVFLFNGMPYNQYKVSSTGVLTFDLAAAAVPGVNNEALPSAEIPDNSIAVWGLKTVSASEVITTKSFGTAPNRQHWISFRAFEYEEANAPIADIYWSIVLEESSNRIYLVDQRGPAFSSWDPSLTLGLQFDQNNALQVDGSPNIPSQAGNGTTPNDNTYYAFNFGSQPKNDVEILEANPKDLLVLDEGPFEISTTLINLGSELLSSVKLYYSVDGQAVGAHHIESPGTEVTHRIPWKPTTPGSYEIKVWLEYPNGQNDPTPGNNETTISARVIETPPDRLSLIESFTAHNCGPCATGNPILDAVVDNNYPAVAHLKFVTVFLGQTDPRRLFNPTDNATRVNYYNVNAIPTAYINGTTDKNSAAVNTNDVTSGDNQPGEVAIDIEESVNGSNIDVSVDFTPTNLAYAGQDIRAHVALVQNELYYSSPTGSNGEQDYFYTMRYMIPNGNGTSVAYDGSTTTVSGSRATNPIFEGSLMHVVAYVQNHATRQILMATKSPGMYFCDNGSVIAVEELMVDNVACQNASNGRIELQLSGGSEPYNVSWTGTSTSGLVAENLTAGTYTATVSDQSGCSFEVPTRVQVATSPQVEIEASLITCNGEDDAVLKAITSGSGSNFSYSWSTGATTDEISSLTPGSYSVTVTDAGGCTASDDFTLVEPTTLEATAQAIQGDPSGNNEGVATVAATGGVAPYSYSWTSGATTDTATNLGVGTYEVTVTDFNGCNTTQTVTVDAVGIEQAWQAAGLSQWTLSPNPARDQVMINIELATPQAMRIQLFDQQGRLLRQQQVAAGQQYQQGWDLSQLSAGFYSLQLRTEQGQAQRRLIVR
jgi:thiol-disulfide isomerase/thioredoxin